MMMNSMMISSRMKTMMRLWSDGQLAVLKKALVAAAELGVGLLEATEVVEPNPIHPNGSTSYSNLYHCDRDGVYLYMDTVSRQIEDAIRKIMDELKPPILSIPGMGFHSAAMILAEVGDFSNFNSPDKVLAYAGCSPSTYQSGKLTNCYAHMEKRGSRYLRYALYTATKYVCYWNPVFTEYLTKKQAEGKHYNVALSHATKKLVRLIYALQKSGKAYLAVT